MRRLRRWYIPACRGRRQPAGRAGPQAGAGPAGRRRPAARIAAAVYVSPELYRLPVYQEFASLRPPLAGGRTRLVIINMASANIIGSQNIHQTDITTKAR